jgi:hypothetical protein
MDILSSKQLSFVSEIIDQVDPPLRGTAWKYVPVSGSAAMINHIKDAMDMLNANPMHVCCSVLWYFV